VRDVAIALGLLTGVDPADSKTTASAGNTQTDYTAFLKTDGLKGKRIGLLKNTTGFHPKVDALLNETVAYLKSQGAEVVEIQFPLDPSVYSASFQVMLYEFKDGLNNYLKGLGANVPVKTLKELIAFNKTDSVELKYFSQVLLEQAEAKGDLQSPEYKKALSDMLKATRENGIDKVLRENKLDALMAPTGGPAWKTDLINGDLFLGSSSSYAAISGYPDISVPMGFIDELPVGVSFFGKAWSEPTLLEIAYAYEQGTKHRKAPKYIKTN
jgi:amidase